MLRSSDNSLCLDLRWLPRDWRSTCSSRRCAFHASVRPGMNHVVRPGVAIAQLPMDSHNRSRTPDAKDSRRAKLGFHTQSSFSEPPGNGGARPRIQLLVYECEKRSLRSSRRRREKDALHWSYQKSRNNIYLFCDSLLRVRIVAVPPLFLPIGVIIGVGPSIAQQV
jgi:hypothetical protein